MGRGNGRGVPVLSLILSRGISRSLSDRKCSISCRYTIDATRGRNVSPWSSRCVHVLYLVHILPPSRVVISLRLAETRDYPCASVAAPKAPRGYPRRQAEKRPSQRCLGQCPPTLGDPCPPPPLSFNLSSGSKEPTPRPFISDHLVRE